MIDDIATVDRGPRVLGTEWIADGLTKVTMQTTGEDCTYTASIGSPTYGHVWQEGLVRVALDDVAAKQANVQLRMSNRFQGQVSFPVHLVLVCYLSHMAGSPPHRVSNRVVGTPRRRRLR